MNSCLRTVLNDISSRHCLSSSLCSHCIRNVHLTPHPRLPISVPCLLHLPASSPPRPSPAIISPSSSTKFSFPEPQRMSIQANTRIPLFRSVNRLQFTSQVPAFKYSKLPMLCMWCMCILAYCSFDFIPCLAFFCFALPKSCLPIVMMLSLSLSAQRAHINRHNLVGAISSNSAFLVSDPFPSPQHMHAYLQILMLSYVVQYNLVTYSFLFRTFPSNATNRHISFFYNDTRRKEGSPHQPIPDSSLTTKLSHLEVSI